jgi:serine/threonine-protein kinase
MADEINPAYLQPGTPIGFYEVVTLVGKGGFGALYKVTRGGQVFALKLSTFKFSELSEDDRRHYMARAKREAGALMQLHHPNVVRVHGFEQWPEIENGYLYLVMDFVDGLQLYDWRKKHSPSLKQIALVFQKIALALNQIHECEIFHRDLKSENVLIRNSDGEPILVDFGLARPRSAYAVTHVDEIVGSYSSFTPEYCKHAFSPGKDKKPFVYRPTTDLHAVGFMLYDVLTGRPPFDVDTGQQIDLLIQIEDKVPTPPTLINPHVPGALEEIAMKLLEKDPQNRFQTGADLAAALAQALERAGASWDGSLEVPAPAKADGPTLDVRRSAPRAAPKEKAEQLRGGSDTVRPVEEPAARKAQEKPNELENPPATEPEAAPTDTQAAPNAKADFTLPIDQRAFQLPEGEAVAEQQPLKPHSFTSAIQRLKASSRAASSRTRAGPILAVVGILLVAIFATALIVSKRAREARRPESLLAKFRSSPPSSTPPGTQSPTMGEASFFPASPVSKSAAGMATEQTQSEPPTREHGSRRGAARKTNAKGSDSANIDAMLASTYGRPTISEKAPQRGISASDPPWLQRAHRMDGAAGKQTASAQKKLGVPFGTHLRARLATNLDSRTIADGWVEAALMRPFFKDRDTVLPSKTMLYGQARTSGGRFTVQFFRLRLPDNTEVPFSGVAVDLEDNKPGLAASGRIAAPPSSKESLASRVAKNAAGTVLGKLTGDDATDVARGAGQTALSYSDGTPGFGTGETLLLDAGRDFEVIVREAF